ncbi:glycosyltransferase involved in cell wall biosynthesis [Terracoccus luteus]|uniref:Glycosyltransferase involved in cell wall biosynthesis n=1 Tax=Terracoccus luteus TaxID=53356 RepID=A0A495XV74_9MICO|nr:glycosyltransferase [Terracoccus luteus]RKT78471.1 glycosyltransferase involved in cell wall biosynthesis [Terracoccus luteus]
MRPRLQSRSIHVAVLTYHRPEPLGRLLPVLLIEAARHEDSSPTDTVTLVVVDNDPHGSARQVVQAASVGSPSDPSSPDLRYVVEPRPGISAGRNRALDESSEADLLVFIDDDETPHPGWLERLVRLHDESGAEAVAGPVRSVVDAPLDPWVVAGRFFDRSHHLGRAQASVLPRAASNNLLLDLRFVRAHGLRFDDRFGLTGGEDSLFTGQLVAAGGTIRWAADAVVDDHLPSERLTRDYALRRTFHIANSSTRAEGALSADPRARARWVAGSGSKAVGRLATGVPRLLAGALTGNVRLQSRGHRDVARARGTASALLGRHSAPYGGREPRDESAPILVAHPSSDLYGSDLQLVETVRGLRESGHEVQVLLPEEGPLGAHFTALGATVDLVPSPVLRKSLMSPEGLMRFGLEFTRATVSHLRLLRRTRPAALLVNTVTIPAWLLAARLARVPVVCHVHEAEADQPRPVRVALAAPLLLARRVVTNSQASGEVVTGAIPRLADRIRLTYNGIDGPTDPAPPRRRAASDPVDIVLVGRLSPRKGSDVALEAVALVRAEGVDARLSLCGSAFAGYEWFEQQLRERATLSDLEDAVELRGYVADPAAALTEADIVLVPSRVEPFGNAAVEALLARRPLVASATQGLREIVRDGDTGLLVPPDDAAALAAAILRLTRDPEAAAVMADRGRADAIERFSVERYRQDMAKHVEDVTAARAGA